MRAIEAGTTSEKKWTELIRQHQQSGLSVSVFCRDRGFSDQAFYYWRKRLSVDAPVRFALVAAGAATTTDHAPIELLLASGDRLRIPPGADAVTLRTVLNILREHA
jgi:transposase-like protein